MSARSSTPRTRGMNARFRSSNLPAPSLAVARSARRLTASVRSHGATSVQECAGHVSIPAITTSPGREGDSRDSGSSSVTEPERPARSKASPTTSSAPDPRNHPGAPGPKDRPAFDAFSTTSRSRYRGSDALQYHCDVFPDNAFGSTARGLSRAGSSTRRMQASRRTGPLGDDLRVPTGKDADMLSDCTRMISIRRLRRSQRTSGRRRTGRCVSGGPGASAVPGATIRAEEQPLPTFAGRRSRVKRRRRTRARRRGEAIGGGGRRSKSSRCPLLFVPLPTEGGSPGAPPNVTQLPRHVYIFAMSGIARLHSCMAAVRRRLAAEDP